MTVVRVACAEPWDWAMPTELCRPGTTSVVGLAAELLVPWIKVANPSGSTAPHDHCCPFDPSQAATHIWRLSAALLSRQTLVCEVTVLTGVVPVPVPVPVPMTWR